MVMVPNPKFGYNTEDGTDNYTNSWSTSESSEDEDMVPIDPLYYMDSINGIEMNGDIHHNTNINKMRDSSESEIELEVPCPAENHDEGREMIDMLLPFSVDHVMSLIFTNSQWFQDFLNSRKTTDYIPSEWQTDPETGDKLRQLSYTLLLNLTLVKSAQSTESQRMLNISKPGEVYVIETDVCNHGVPYSDSFSIKSHNCLTRISKQQCRFRVHSQICYKKSVWGLTKTVIEKNAMQGAIDFCADIEKALKLEAEKVNKQGSHQKEQRQMISKLMKSDHKISNEQISSNINKKKSTNASFIPGIERETNSSKISTEFIVKAILIMLVLLLLLNMMLILKLGSLEDLSVKLNSYPDEIDTSMDNIPNLSRGEFLRILRKQEVLHRTEISKWQEALNDVLKLFHLMESSLLDLKHTIESYSNSATIKSVISESEQTEKPAV